MPTIEQSIEVEVPVHAAYAAWTQFEDFPHFMEGVEEVRRLDANRLHWTAEVAGHREEWDAEITEQLPDERVAWKATSGQVNAGVVTFHRLEERRSRVMVQLDWASDGMVEKLGDMLGMDDRRVRGDLERFKEMIERGQTDA